MVRKSMKMEAAAAGLSVLCGCAGLRREARPEPIERLDEYGVSARLLEVTLQVHHEQEERRLATQD